MNKIYGNTNTLSAMESMVKRDKAAHTVMICGERGTGKKLVAQYYTLLLMCESPSPDGKPCGCCTACKNVMAGTHPDVMTVPKSGKLGGYSVETTGNISNDAYVKPNNKSGRKVYIFADCKNFDARPQNKLLKLIEEPPDYAYFIFTAESRSVFLPTIVSRCVSFSTAVCTEEDSRSALAENGFSPEEINSAVECFHGNIGMCMSFLGDDELRKRVDLTKSLADSIIRRDEYSMNAVFSEAAKDRNSAFEIFSMLDKLVRDAAVMQDFPEAETIGCFREGAFRLSQQLTFGQAEKLHRYIENAVRSVESNASLPLVTASLCAEIMDTID